MSQPTCVVCDGAVLHGNLTCSLKCGETLDELCAANRAAMQAAGFAQDEAAPNVYRKDGISITLEHVNHDGLDKVLSHHTTVAAIRAHALGVLADTEPAAHGAAAAGAR